MPNQQEKSKSVIKFRK